MRGLPVAVLVLLVVSIAPTVALAPPSTATNGSESAASTSDIGTVATVTTNGTTARVTETVTNTTNDTVDGVGETVTESAQNATDSASDATTSVTDTTLTAGGIAVAGEGTRSVAGELNGTVSEANVSANVTASVGIGDQPTTDAARHSTPSTETSTNASSAGQGDAGGDSSTGGDSGVRRTAGGALALGLGAGLTAMLARRSATLAALGPDVAATLWRHPSPLAHLHRGLGGRRWLLRVLGLFGYSQYDDSDPLEHETRVALLDRITDSPGAYLSQLNDLTGVPTSTIRHHLDVLEREGLVTGARLRGKRRYFPLDAGSEELLAALEDDASATVIRYLAREGPESVSAIATDLDRDVSTISHHLTRLAEDGLVERERDGRSVLNRLAPTVEEFLIPARNSTPRSPRTGIDA